MGFFRLFLALLVVTTHIFYPYWFGHFAVFGFYIISGYLMTLVMHKKYTYSSGGVFRFCINRIVRIYPAYVLVLLMSILSFYLIGDESREFNVALGFPRDINEWFQNLVIIGMDNTYSTRVIPPAWALSVELVFYLLIALGLSKNIFITALWFSVSLCITVYLIVFGFDFSDRYFTVWAASLPFSIGAMLFYYKSYFSRVSLFISWKLIAVLACYTYISPVLILKLSEEDFFYFLINPHGFVMYFNIVLMVMVFVKLTAESYFKTNKLDKLAGDLSYPVYLSHWLVGFLLSILIYGESFRPSLLLLMVTVPVCLALSYIIVVYEKFFENIRVKVRGSNE